MYCRNAKAIRGDKRLLLFIFFKENKKFQKCLEQKFISIRKKFFCVLLQ
jgi:hypothetical protein